MLSLFPSFLLRLNPKPPLSLFSCIARSSSPILIGLSSPIPPGFFPLPRRCPVFPLSLVRQLSVESGSPSSLSSVRGRMEVAANSVAEASSGAKKFWLRSKNEAMLATYTPFVVCLASGKLELETFRQYIAQDFHFLRSFASAYEKAGEYADDGDAKATISELQKAVLDEMNLHNSVIQEWGIDPSKDVLCSPATVKYINFLSAISDGKIGGKDFGKIATQFEKTIIAAYIVGAMVPCMRLYAFLGKELEPFLKIARDHPYSSWIKKYSSSEFEEAATLIEDLLDKLSVPLTGEELDVIGKLYLQAMKLEIEFFLAQTIMQPTVVPLIGLHDPKKRFCIFSDFDLTCTVVDSTAILAEIAIAKAPKTTDLPVANRSIDWSPSSELRETWKALSAKYAEDYQQCIDTLLKGHEAKAFDMDDLYKHFEHLSEFEKQANSRVFESGVLRDMNIDDIKESGEHLKLQEGCASFLQKIVMQKKKMNAELHILSYCWCADLIRSALSAAGCLGSVSVHSNEFMYAEGSLSTGEVLRNIETPLDKIRVFKHIINRSSNEEYLSVYIGDSVGDLLCLLEADVGIVLGSSESLRKVGKRFGVSFIPLFVGSAYKQREAGLDASSAWRAKSGVIYTASGWPEIQAFILGHH
ncbi:thiaminase (transcriptional activator TenA) [Apostasia shenzhenica]|uniref:Thiaminase (Transcriptional activator TenA) n=1 Tax=Apostasia shenzhenica TaxID=1088818 RepID=A0A2I0AT96_9ASPA|nr:thiaminase (transcriptional activator TenA) [Apostasia shenzhenica]